MSQRGKNEMDCGDLKESGSHSLIWSGTIKKCGLVEVCVAFLEEVYHWGQTLRSQKLKPSLEALFSYCQLSAPSTAPCLLYTSMLPTMTIMD